MEYYLNGNQNNILSTKSHFFRTNKKNGTKKKEFHQIGENQSIKFVDLDGFVTKKEVNSF